MVRGLAMLAIGILSSYVSLGSLVSAPGLMVRTKILMTPGRSHQTTRGAMLTNRDGSRRCNRERVLRRELDRMDRMKTTAE